MKQRLLFGVLPLLLFPGLVCPCLWSQPQTPTRAPSSDTASAVQPAPIPAASIASEVEAANSRLRGIRLDLDSAVKLSALERQLAGLASSVQRIRPAIEGGSDLREEDLFNFRQELMRLSLRLKQFQSELDPRIRVLEERREELRRMEQVWRLTDQSLSVQEAPGSSRDLVRATKRRIDETVAVLRTYWPILLTVQNRVSEQSITMDVLMVRTNEAVSQIRKGFFLLDSEPLWKEFRSWEPRSSVIESIRQSYVSRALPLFDYFKDQKVRFLAHLLIFSLLLWLVNMVSRSGRIWVRETGEKRSPGEILRHPRAAALVISLLLSFSLYPNAPLTLYRLPLLLMMFPLARVVSGVLSRNERLSFYSLAGLYLLWRMDALFSSVSLVFRCFILLMACLGILVALWGVTADRVAARAGIGPWRRARLRLSELAAAILLGAIIANIAGNVTLAALLTGACISSAYTGAAIFAGVLVIEGFVLPISQSPFAQKSIALREQSGQFQRRFSLLIRCGALVAWLWTTLVFFGIFGPIQAWLYSVLSGKHSFGQITFSIGGILLFPVTILVSVWAGRFAAFVAERDVLSRMKLPQGIPATISMLVRDVIIGFGFILALAGAGVQWSQIVLVASAIGVGIGLGLQQLVGSFIAGLILIFERPIRVGDTIEIGKVEGTVTRIGLRSSTIRAVDGSEIICPNNRLISEDLLNWTLSDQLRRVELQVGVSREADPDLVLSILERAAGKHKDILQRPKPVALFKGFGENSLKFILRFFTLNGVWNQTSSETVTEINNALRDAGIELAVPQRNVRIARGAAPNSQSASGSMSQSGS